MTYKTHDKLCSSLKLNIYDNVLNALSEDIGGGDVTANLIPEELDINAKIITRESMMLCGIDWVNTVFGILNRNIKITWHYNEGDLISEMQTLCNIEGNARSIFTGERTALNFLQTLSATAFSAYQYVAKLKNFHTKLLDTRKTLPGLRLAQKYAVACAGGINHRKGLYDAYLIKENHIKACGSITDAIIMAREIHPDFFVEIEVETLAEYQEALRAKPDRILLDNFSLDMIKEAVALNSLKVSQLEASGNINLDNITLYAKTNVDYVSVGGITKSVRAIDLSLLVA